MRLARFSIFLAVLGFGGFGALLLIAPWLLEPAGVAARNAAGTVELRAFYGGLELGLAVCFALALRRPSWIPPALVLQVSVLGGVVVGRAIGLLLSGGEANVVTYVSWAGELLGTGVAAVALWRLRPALNRTG